MKMHDLLLGAAKDALRVPLSPAPGYTAAPSAVYRFYPGRCDGALCTARLTVRVFHRSVAAAMAEIDSLRRALLHDGDTGILGTGGDTIVVCGTDEGGRAGHVRGTDLYFVQAGFEVQGRTG